MTEWIYDPKAGRCRKTDGGKTMTDKTEEIRNRHKRLEDMRSSTYPDEISDSWTYFGTWAAHHDRATLLAEDDRKSAEIEKLRADNERLREVIRTIRARCVELDDSDAVSETLDIATAVLEDEP